MLRTLGCPLQAHKADCEGGSIRFPVPTLIGTGETVYLLQKQEAPEYRSFLWKGDIYQCSPQDLLAALIAPKFHAARNDENGTHIPKMARMDDRRHIAALACQLSNGAKYNPGDLIPVGWNSSRERIFITVTPDMLTEAAAETRVD